LGHIVGKDGVSVDPKKTKSMNDWPHPKNLKSLRGFLGLTRYYCKFVQNYGKIAGKGIGTVFMQYGIPLACTSKQIYERHL
jgi:hypothetical protein